MITPGYSGKPLSAKLGIKPGFRIACLNAPGNIEQLLDPLPSMVEFVRDDEQELDLALVFETEAAALRVDFESLRHRIRTAGMIWVAWPKRAAKASTDLDENIVREIGLDLRWVDVKVCAVSDYWSGLKFVRRLADRTQAPASQNG